MVLVSTVARITAAATCTTTVPIIAAADITMAADITAVDRAVPMGPGGGRLRGTTVPAAPPAGGEAPPRGTTVPAAPVDTAAVLRPGAAGRAVPPAGAATAHRGTAEIIYPGISLPASGRKGSSAAGAAAVSTHKRAMSGVGFRCCVPGSLVSDPLCRMN